MENDFLKFYGQNNISPVRQEISDYEKHCLRRRNLYRQLGIPICSFRDTKILEIGAGGGYNTVPLFEYGGRVDILEPNKKGREDIESLFSIYRIAKEKYKIFDSLIEDFESKEKYDFIIAEGFIQHLDNSKQILLKLEEFAHKDSIIIITCSDEIGLYVERMKRLVGNYLVRDIVDYDSKVTFLVDIYKSQLTCLKGMSRKVEDWVQDQILNPAMQSENLFTLKEAIEMYIDDFDVLGSSQSIFVDNSWYKNIEYNYKENYITQYDQKKHILLFADQFEESIVKSSVNNQLEMQVTKINKLARIIEKDCTWISMEDLIKEIKILNEVTVVEELVEFNNELIEIIKTIKNGNVPELISYKKFSQSFGKSQQYISFSKK